MKFDVHYYVNGQPVKKEDLHKFVFTNKSIDRIINSIAERYGVECEEDDEESA